jgi:hypothetical protein
MSKIALSGNASGTGTFTIASPNSNTDQTLSLPDATGTVFVSGQPVTATTGSFSGDVTFGSSVLATPTGSAPSYTCRAWVNFNGTGTVAIRASGNVSSITDNGTGNYTVNFTNAMPDANYCCLFSTGNDSGSGGNGLWATRVGASRSTTGIQVLCGRPDTGALADASDANISVFR